MLRKFWLLFLPLAFAGCDQQPAAQAAVPDAQTTPPAGPGVVDSIFPVAEDIRRFKAQFTGPLPTELEHGAHSRDALVSEFLQALQTRDTMRLRSLAINASEFIELYYPYTQFTRPPYRQSPALTWFLIQQNSEKGLTRALARLGGQTVPAGPAQCESAKVQEQNRIWSCRLPVAAAGQTTPIRLFGAILERHGRFKFVSFANDF